MSFNRRGGDRRPDRPDRPDRDRGERPSYPARGGDRPPYQRGGGGGDRPPYQRGGGGGDRPPYQPRPRFNPEDEGAMQIRLDPRRLSALKRLAGEAGTRPGELARQWVEERIDAARTGGERSLAEQLSDLVSRVEALEAERDGRLAAPSAETVASAADQPTPDQPEAAETEGAVDTPKQPGREARPRTRARRNAVSAAPTERVALHDEMIAVLRERGPMTASDLAAAIVERGRYSPPRSGKPLTAAVVSQRVSNPIYRARFTRRDGKIGLADSE